MIQSSASHSSGFKYFSVLARITNDFKVTLMESLLVNRDHPPLHKEQVFATFKAF